MNEQHGGKEVLHTPFKACYIVQCDVIPGKGKRMSKLFKVGEADSILRSWYNQIDV